MYRYRHTRAPASNSGSSSSTHFPPSAGCEKKKKKKKTKQKTIYKGMVRKPTLLAGQGPYSIIYWACEVVVGPETQPILSPNQQIE